MDEKRFLDWAIALLEEIESSAEKQCWCQKYSVYSDNPGQDQLSDTLSAFFDYAYRYGLVITNYHKVIEMQRLDEGLILRADATWVAELSYECALACIAYHFRRDHFCEGALINNSIASGAMLRLLRQLRAQQNGPSLATTLETLYRSNCEGVPDTPGIYRVLAPEEMTICFENSSANKFAPLYPIDILEDKYRACHDKRLLYIGKANGVRGLRQRIRQYVKYGWNEAVNHKGGRAIWQIRDADLLLLEYEPGENCETREHELLQEFHERNHKYPVANWRG